MPRYAKDTRTFNGKTYRWTANSKTKAGAQKIAKARRKEGEKARVIKSVQRGGWAVMTRRGR